MHHVQHVSGDLLMTPHVLVVDDDPLIRLLARECLQGLGMD